MPPDVKTLKKCSLLREVAHEEATKATAAYGMLLSANSTREGSCRDDALEVLTALAFAKAKLDSAAAHTHSTIDVTSEILLAAQQYADDATIPCTEWPSSEEIVAHVLKTASKYGNVKSWDRYVYGDHGGTIGIQAPEDEIKCS